MNYGYLEKYGFWTAMAKPFHLQEPTKTIDKIMAT